MKPEGDWARIRRMKNACEGVDSVCKSEVWVEGGGAAEKMVKGCAWRMYLWLSEGMVRKTWSLGFQPCFIEFGTRVVEEGAVSQFAESRIVSSSSRMVRVAGCEDLLSQSRNKSLSTTKMVKEIPTYGRDVWWWNHSNTSPANWRKMCSARNIS